METLLYYAAAAVGISAMAFVTWWLLPDERSRRAMRAVRCRPIAECTDGATVRVVGEVRGVESVSAPLTGRACAYWRVSVEVARGSKRRRWVTILEVSGGADFVVHDGTAKALVTTDGAVADLQRDGSASGYLRAATPGLEAFLRAHGHPMDPRALNESFRCHEGIVVDGQRLCVVGVGRWERDPDADACAGGGYRDAELPERLALDAPSDGPLRMSDHASLG